MRRIGAPANHARAAPADRSPTRAAASTDVHHHHHHHHRFVYIYGLWDARPSQQWCLEDRRKKVQIKSYNLPVWCKRMRAAHIVCAIRLFSSGFVVLRSDFGVFFGLFFWSARARGVARMRRYSVCAHSRVAITTNKLESTHFWR